MQRRQIGRMLSLALLGATMALGCQLPNQFGIQGLEAEYKNPAITVSLGEMRIAKGANFAIVLKFQRNGSFNAQALAGIAKVTFKVTGQKLAAPLTAEVTNFVNDTASVSFAKLPPGPVDIAVNALDASGNIISYATGSATIQPGLPTVATLKCVLADGSLDIVYDCCDATPAPSPTPIPTSAPSPGTVLAKQTGLNRPWAITFDALGYGWVSNYGTNEIVKIAPDSSIVASYSVGAGPHEPLIDDEGHVWVTCYDGNVVTRLNVDGTNRIDIPVGTRPLGIAKDATGNMWVANYGGSSISKISPDALTVQTYLGVANLPWGIFVKPDGKLLVTDWQIPYVFLVSPTTGTEITRYSTGTNPSGINIDASGSIWIANYGSNSVTKLADSGALLGTYSVGSGPEGIAFDLNGNVWVTNRNSNNVSVLSPSGVTIDTLNVGVNPTRIARDPSGNIWTTNFLENSVTKIAPTIAN